MPSRDIPSSAPSTISCPKEKRSCVRSGLWLGLAMLTVLAVVGEVRANFSENSSGEPGVVMDNKYAVSETASNDAFTTCPPNNASSPLKTDVRPVRYNAKNPIDFLRGHVIESANDVSLPGIAPGTGFAQSRSYSSGHRNSTAYQPRSLLGARWVTGQADMILDEVGSDIELYVDATSKRVFTNPTVVGSATVYDAPSDMNVTFAKTGSGANEIFTLTNIDSGEVLVFYGLDSSVAVGSAGRLKEQSTRAIQTKKVVSGVEFTYNEHGRITLITTAQGWSATYTYVGGGSAVAYRIRSIEIENGASTVLSDVEYTYYDDVSSPSSDIGSSGDLVQVRTRRRDSANSAWITRYTQYRYYTNASSDGKEHQLKCVIESDAIQRILDTGDTDVESTTEILEADDTTDVSGDDLSAFYSRIFTYYTSNENTSGSLTTAWASENLATRYGGSNADEYPVTYAGMAKSETVNGDCTSCGGSGGHGIRTEYYYMDLNGGPDDGGIGLDDVARLIIEDTVTDSDGDGDIDDAQYRTIYGVNKEGRLLRRAIIDDPTAGTYDAWCNSTVLGTAGNSTNRVTETRMPSAHVLVNTDAEMQDFLDPTSGTNDADTLENTQGVIYTFEYNSDGRRSAMLVQEGENGTAYYTSYTEYGDGTNDKPAHLPVETRVYPTAVSANPDSNGIATAITYTFHNHLDTVIKSRTVTLQSVPTNQNGSGVSTAMTQYFDQLGRLRWTQDGEGYCTYHSYHPDTGGLAYTVRDADPASLPASADSNSTKWITSSTDGASTNKPTRSGSLPTAIAMVTYSEFDDQGRTVKRVTATPSASDEDDVTYTVYEATRTLVFPQWDSASHESLLPIRVTEVDDAGVMQKSYTVQPDRVDLDGSNLPEGLLAGTTQAHYVTLTTYVYDPVTGQQTETRRYHDIPSSGAGTLSTHYDATIYKYDHMGRREYTIQTVSGTSAGAAASVEQVTKVIYQHPFMDRIVATVAGVSDDSHAMSSDYSTYPTLRLMSLSVYDDGVIGDGHMTRAVSFFGTGPYDVTAVNYFRDYRGRLRGIRPIYYNGAAETAIGPFTVQDIRWDGRVTNVSVYDTEPTWATVLADDDYAGTITTDRRARSQSLYDNLGRVYRTRNYTVNSSTGSTGSYFRTDRFYDRNNRVVAVAPAYSAATEMAYDGLGRQYQTRSVARLEGEPEASGDTADLTSNDYTCYTGGAFIYCTPTPNPDFSDMTGTDGYVYALSHTEYSDDSGDADPATGEMGLPTRRYNVDQNGDNQSSGKVGVDFTNDDDYVVTYAYTYYDDADRPIAVINHGSGAASWTYGAEPGYDSTDVPEFTDDGTSGSPDVEGLEALLTTFGYDADTGRRNLVTSAIGVSDPLTTINTKTFFDDLGRTTHVAENHDDFTPSTPSTIGDGSDTSKDRVTAVAYDGLSNVTSQTAYNSSSANDQVTNYYYEDAVSASRVTHIVYPDSASTPSSGSDLIELTYNVDGSIATRTDQRGVEITFVYNDRRQLAYQDVTSFGASGDVDTAIQSIGRTYDDLARLEKVTSYDDISTGSPAAVNEVQFAYNDTGQLVESYQNHDGAVDTGTSPNVTYTYDLSQVSSVYDDSGMLAKLDYPSAPSGGGDGVYSGRRRVTFTTLSGNGVGGDTWNIYQRMNRVYGINEASTSTGNSGPRLLQTLSSGQGRLSRLYFDKMDNNPGPSGNVTLLNMWRVNTDAGYDRFGRTASITYDVNSVSDHAVDLSYGYDAGSNRLYREDALADDAYSVDADELYGHDDLSRMNNFEVGDVNTSTLALTSGSFEQEWGLDALGNWATFKQNDDGTGASGYELEQTRTANDANEIGTIAATTGTNWVDPTYDAAGNMTKRADPAEPDNDAKSHLMTYDAWNRLVKITDDDAPTTIATYEYDGLGRRIQKTVGADTYDYYHSSSWQVLEVRLNGDTDPYEQFVYDGTYIDAPFMRYVDHNQDGDYDDADEGEHYFFRDASYNIVAYTADDGTVLERYRYTPYGKRIAMTSAFVDKAGTDHAQQRGFQGLLHDEESGLIENRRRMLDPLTGRFLQHDPLMYIDGLSLYNTYHVMRGGQDAFGLQEDGPAPNGAYIYKEWDVGFRLSSIWNEATEGSTFFDQTLGDFFRNMWPGGITFNIGDWIKYIFPSIPGSDFLGPLLRGGEQRPGDGDITIDPGMFIPDGYENKTLREVFAEMLRFFESALLPKIVVRDWVCGDTSFRDGGKPSILMSLSAVSVLGVGVEVSADIANHLWEMSPRAPIEQKRLDIAFEMTITLDPSILGNQAEISGQGSSSHQQTIVADGGRRVDGSDPGDLPDHFGPNHPARQRR